MELTSIPIIVTVCLVVGKLIRESPVNSRLIPVICGFLGSTIGVIGYYFMPDFPADNVVMAVFVGLSSGLAATGTHQAVTQIKDEE